MSDRPFVSIVLVNYNTAADTIECIDSILNIDKIDLSIVVVDNSTSDDFNTKLNSWIKKEYKPHYKIPDSLTDNLSGKTPEKYSSISTNDIDEYLTQNKSEPVKLTVIKNSENTGFAKANNIGIKYSLQFSPTYLWLLNNDTVIKKDALEQLIKFHTDLKSQGVNIGLAGSKILFYSNPEIIQAVGDRFNILTTRSYHIGLNENDTGQYDDKAFQIDYPYGASLFFNSEYIRKVGFMSEDYFLYFEEIDWVTRGRKKGFIPAICTTSKIFHKQGISTGKSITQKKIPSFIACLMYSNLLKFYWKYYPFLYPIAWIRLLLKMNLTFIKGNINETKLIFKILLGFRNCNIIKDKIE